MSDRTYRAILGALLLLALYFDITELMQALIIILFIEGVTNFRIPILVSKFSGNKASSGVIGESTGAHQIYRFNFESERAWRLLVGSMLLITYVFFYRDLWFFHWFMGFAIFGAGVSGVCPMKIVVNKIGFR